MIVYSTKPLDSGFICTQVNDYTKERLSRAKQQKSRFRTVEVYKTEGGVHHGQLLEFAETLEAAIFYVSVMQIVYPDKWFVVIDQESQESRESAV